jgi:hypothetical protein
MFFPIDEELFFRLTVLEPSMKSTCGALGGCFNGFAGNRLMEKAGLLPFAGNEPQWKRKYMRPCYFATLTFVRWSGVHINERKGERIRRK